MLAALILAGGKGTRFWPVSTAEKPKQFINLLSNKSMLQLTFDRINKTIDKNNIFISTNKEYFEIVRKQLPDLPEQNIIIEPTSKNTAPSILLCLLYIKQIYSDFNLIVMPSDHKINNEIEFNYAINDAENFLNSNKKSIITFGIKPTRPDQNYGYINFGDYIKKINTHQIYKINKFTEKPNEKLANEFLKNGKYLWNSRNVYV